MILRQRSFWILLTAAFCFVVPAIASANEPQAISIPLTFEQNLGQVGRDTCFLAHAGHGTILLSEKGVVLAAPGSGSGRFIRMHLLRAVKVTPIGETLTGGFASYYTSNDRSRWLSHIPLFSRVRYAEVYPGIDAVFRGRGDELEYDFEVAPGSSPNDISFGFDGAEQIFSAADGGLDIVSGDAKWHFLPPVAYQVHGDAREPVLARYAISKSGLVSFQLGEFDPSISLVIDPVVEYANHLPAGDIDGPTVIQVDAEGNPIIAGLSGTQATVMKLNAAGDTILYASHLGVATSPYPSKATGLALDGNGNAYISGITGAGDFPTTSNLGSCNQTCNVGFVAKIAPDGSLVYSTLLGSGQELARAIAVDAGGYAYVVGNATDNLLPTVNAFLTSDDAGANAFFAKLNPAGNAYVFASYFPASEADAIALDGSGDIFIAGNTDIDPPLVNPWQSGAGGIFLAKFAPDGKTLLFSTRFGSSQTPAGDALTGMLIGTDGTIYLAGATRSQDFPFALNPPTHQLLPSEGDYQMFAAAIDPSLTKLIYSTYLGVGSLNAIALDSASHLHVAGTTMAGRILPLQNAIDSDVSGGFLLELDRSGMPVNASQFGGHFSTELPQGIAVDPSGNVYLAGGGGPSPQDNFSSFFGYPSDPVMTAGPTLPGPPGDFFAKISPANSPQISLSTVAPFLILRDAGSADLHIGSVKFSAAKGGGQVFGNCAGTVPAGGSCVLTVSDNGGNARAGSVTITSDAGPSAQTFAITLPSQFNGVPIGDQLWAQDTRFYHPPQLEGTAQVIPMTIWNIGTANATLNAITTTGDLSETDNCGAQAAGGAALAPGMSCTLQVSYTPGGDQGQLHFFYDGVLRQDFFAPLDFFLEPTTQAVVLSAGAINFGTEQVNGVAFPRVVTVTNTGNAIVSTPFVSIQGDPEFVIAGNTCTSDLGPHQSCIVGVQFNPIDDSAPSATLNVSGQTVDLLGQGQISSLVQVSPLELDFSPDPAGHSGIQTLSLTNSSTTPVIITTISFSLPDFSETDNCQGQIPANGNCMMQVAFSPQQLGPRDGEMTIDFSGGVSTQIITITGSGAAPLQIMPASLVFGSPAPGTSSDPQGVSLGNGAGLPPQGYSLAITGDFVISQNGCPNPLPSFTGCGINVTFQPKSSGLEQGTLIVSYPGIPEQSIVALSGGSGPGPNINVPTRVNFGNQALASTGSQMATITNSENAILAISSIAVSGPNAVDFAVAPGQCQTVGPGTSCAIQIDFSPGAIGQRNASLTIVDNASTSPQNIALQGNGVSTFTLQVSPLSVSVASGGTATYQVTAASAPGFTGIVKFTCNEDAPHATCSVTPASVDFSKVMSANVVLIVSTAGSTSSAMMLRSIDFIAGLICLPALFMARRPRTAILVLAFLFVTIGFGCRGSGGGGSAGTAGGTGASSTPPGSYTITLNASGAIDSQIRELVLVIM